MPKFTPFPCVLLPLTNTRQKLMDKLRITGGQPLQGDITVSGAKNAALPILCASLLSADAVTLRNVPSLRDIDTTLKLLGQLGVGVDRQDRKSTRLNSSHVKISYAV